MCKIKLRYAFNFHPWPAEFKYWQTLFWTFSSIFSWKQDLAFPSSVWRRQFSWNAKFFLSWNKTWTWHFIQIVWRRQFSWNAKFCLSWNKTWTAFHSNCVEETIFLKCQVLFSRKMREIHKFCHLLKLRTAREVNLLFFFFGCLKVGLV